MSTGSGRILYFDGLCTLCNGTVRWIIRHDRRAVIRFASLQGEAGVDFLRSNGLASGTPGTFIYHRDGKVLDRSTAALRVAGDLGLPWKLAMVFILVPRPLRDAVYNVIARNRYRWFGMEEVCMVPSPELQGRFVG